MKFLLLNFAFIFMLVDSASARAWAAHEASLRSQIDKIREKEKKISEIILEKNQHKESAKVNPLLVTLQKEYVELEKFYRDLEEEKRHVRFEHPDQGIEVERKYRAYKIRSIEDMENEIGTEGKLSRLKSKVYKKYGAESLSESATEDAPTQKEEETVEEPKAPPKGKERPKLFLLK